MLALSLSSFSPLLLSLSVSLSLCPSPFLFRTINTFITRRDLRPTQYEMIRHTWHFDQTNSADIHMGWEPFPLGESKELMLNLWGSVRLKDD